MTTRLVGLEIEGTTVDLIIEDGRAGFVSEREIDSSVVCNFVSDLEDTLLDKAARLHEWIYMARAAPEPFTTENPRRNRGLVWFMRVALAGAALLLGMAEVIGLWEMVRWGWHG